jgi:DNA repair exonuclease SbcCD ATPase subunit
MMMTWRRQSKSMDSDTLIERIDARLADRACLEAKCTRLEAKIEALQIELKERNTELEDLRVVGIVSECVDNENAALREFVARLIDGRCPHCRAECPAGRGPDEAFPAGSCSA